MSREYSIVIYHDEQGISTGHFYGKLEGPGQMVPFGKESTGGPINSAVIDSETSQKRYKVSSQNPEENKLVAVRITLTKEQFESASAHLQSATKTQEMYFLGLFDCIQYVQQVYEKAGQVGDFRTLFEKYISLNSLAIRTTYNLVGPQSEIEKQLMSWLPNTIKIYTVKEGDDIPTIARNCGITEKELLDNNPGIKESCIYRNGHCSVKPVHGQSLKLPSTAIDHSQVSIHLESRPPSITRLSRTLEGVVLEDVIGPGITFIYKKLFASFTSDGEVTIQDYHHNSKPPDVERTIGTAIDAFAKLAAEIANNLPKGPSPLIKTYSPILAAARTGIHGILSYAEAQAQNRQYPATVAIVQTEVEKIAFMLGLSLGGIVTGLIVYYIYHHTLHGGVGDWVDKAVKGTVEIFSSNPQAQAMLEGPKNVKILHQGSDKFVPVKRVGKTIITGQPIEDLHEAENFCTRCAPQLTYMVKKGDTMWGIAQNLGISLKALLDMPGNEKIKASYRSVGNGKFHAHIEPGQRIPVPVNANINDKGPLSVTQCSQKETGASAPNIFVEPLHSRLIPSMLSGLVFSAPSILDIRVGDFSHRNAQDTQPTFLDGRVGGGALHEISMPAHILNGDGFSNFGPSSFVSDYLRPGARELSSENPLADMRKAIFGEQENPYQSSIADRLGQMNKLHRRAARYQSIDPIIINLDGAGVSFVSFEQSFVLFDVDNDGYLEATAWIKRGSAFLVIDKNGNGKVDDVTELAGEHYFDDPRLNTSALFDPKQKKFSMRAYQKHSFQVLDLHDFNYDQVINSTDGIFSSLLLWHDKNENGLCEDTEMHALAEYNIVNISLKYVANTDTRNPEIKYISKSFTKFGRAMLTYAIAFKAQKEGDMLASTKFGSILRSESGLASLKLNKAQVVFVKNHSIQNIYGSDEDDEMHGDEQDNWFFGGPGKDKMLLGDGNDVVIIDAEDDPTEIDGGSGFNIAFATGDTGIMFIMYPSRINQTYGTDFADFIAVGNQDGATSGGFVDSAAGDDLVIGDDASDALSGGDDDDHLKGMGGNDLIRGGRGDDILEGGDGDDILEGGNGKDICFGGDGNDSLKGGREDDKLHGGTGSDAAEYVGSFDEYRIEKLGDGHYIIQDLHQTRDGRDELFEIEQLVFNSVGGAYIVKLEKLFHGYQDFILLAPQGLTIIDSGQLLQNDINFSEQEIYICEVHDPQNGAMTITKVGEKITQIQFNPTTTHQSIKRFGYTLCTESAKDSVTEIATDKSATHYIRVYLTENSHPKDVLFYQQWYLTYTNVVPIWQFYSGHGIKILVNEGLADYTHEDLRDNLKFYDQTNGLFSVHATTVAGVIAAARNDVGLIGIAYNAMLGSESGTSVAHNTYDVIDRSWGWASAKPFTADFSEAQELHMVKTGRHGLGTIIVQSAGNERQKGDNTNDFQQTSSIYSIVVGAIYKDASLSYVESKVEAFSNKGASVLISAPGSHIITSSAMTENNNGNVFTWDYDMVKGTSFSAPIVAGIIALMLEANPALGHRDVGKILATTARKVNDPSTSWNKNADNSWNFEGRHYSYDYGFGCVNAYDAVKFAEFWPYSSTYANMHKVTVRSIFGYKAIAPQKTFAWQLHVSESLIVQDVVLDYEISHTNFSTVSIVLMSPGGSRSTLKEKSARNITESNIKFRGLSKHFIGESANGIWQYEVTNHHPIQLGFLRSANLTIFGDLFTKRLTMITSEISVSHVIETDMVLMPSTRENLQMHLQARHFVSGTGHDTITGNKLGTVIYSNDGDDKCEGQGENDLLIGGRGSDWYKGGAGSDVFVIHYEVDATDTIADFSSEDFVIFVGFKGISDARYEILMHSSHAVFVEQFNYHVFYKIDTQTHYHRIATNIHQLIIGSEIKDVLHGSEAQDLIIGNGGDDILLGWAANDILICNHGNCLVYGHEGNDEIRSGCGINRLFGGPGNDIFVPGSGATDIMPDFNAQEDQIRAQKPIISNAPCLPEYKLSTLICTYLKGQDWQIILSGNNLVLENVFI